jgi:predicted NBD/HSP70 family sugar kinase
MSYSIGIDLGGTNIKIVVISNDGNVLDYLTCDTADAEGSWGQTIKKKIEWIQQQRGESPCHIGLAATAARSLTCRDGLPASRDSFGRTF